MGDLAGDPAGDQRKNVPRPGATVTLVLNVAVASSSQRFHPRRAALRGFLWGVVAVLLPLLAACGGDSGIRISAVTATPEAGTTAPPAGEVGSANPEPTPERVPLPAPPENPFAGGRLVEAYLAGGGALMDECLPELVSGWQLAPSVDGPRCASLDLDGDRRDEWAFLISFGEGEGDESPFPADLWFFQDESEDYRFFNSARALANASTAGLQIRLIEDLTNDGLPEIVMTWLECGASTCTTRLTITSYHHGSLQNLAPSGATVESLEQFEVDGATIRMTGSGAGSVGAGPQRETTTVVRWAGSAFRAEQEQGEATYLVHLVNDADQLFAAGDYGAARDAYLEVAQNSSLPDWRAEAHGAAGRPELQAYSTFRAAIAAYQLGNEDRGIDLLVQVIEGYPNTMHRQAAEEYLLAVVDGNSAGAACGAAEQILDTMRARYVAFWDYGYANPERNVFTLCR